MNLDSSRKVYDILKDNLSKKKKSSIFRHIFGTFFCKQKIYY